MSDLTSAEDLEHQQGKHVGHVYLTCARCIRQAVRLKIAYSIVADVERRKGKNR